MKTPIGILLRNNCRRKLSRKELSFYKDVGLPLVINTGNIIALFRQDNSSFAAEYNLGFLHGPKTVIQLKDPIDGEHSFRIVGDYEMLKERLGNL